MSDENYTSGLDLAPPQPAAAGPGFIPACEICGRQDETLRLVILPYVVSLLVVTFRRAWTGVWCSRHRNERRVLAGLITALAGWVGIPWGFIYTPMALISLAKGGDQPADENARLLQQLAEDTLKTGDPQAAIRILEEALKLKEDAAIRLQLQELYSRYPLSIAEPPPISPWPFVFGLGASIIIGLSIGLLDHFITVLIGLVLGVEVNIFLAILSWVPFVALIFLGGLVLSEVLQWTIEKTRLQEMMLSLVFAAVAALITFYGIPQGQLFGDYLGAVFGGLQFDSFIDFILTTGAVFTQGGLWYLLDSIQSGLLTDWIYLLILTVGGVYFLWISLSSVRETVHWLVRLDLMQGETAIEEERSTLNIWGSIAGIVVGLFLLAVLFGGRGVALRGNPEAVAHIERGDLLFAEGDLDGAAVEFQNAILSAPHLPGPHASLGWVLYSMGDLEGAVSEFVEARRMDNTWADPVLGLAYIYMSQNEIEAARQEFEAALALKPEPYLMAQANYGLGNVAFDEGNLESALAYYQEAILQDWELQIAHLDLALVHFHMGEFDKAVEKANDLIALAPDWGAPHALLAMAYHQLDDSTLEERELAWAEDLQPEDLYSLMLLANAYWDRREFARAEELLLKAVEYYPQNDQAVLTLSYVYTGMQKYDRALELLDPVFARDTYPAGGHLAKGYIFTQLQDLDQALAEINIAKDLDPDDWTVYRDMSFVYFHQGAVQEALAAVEKAEELNPYDSAIFTNKAFAQRSLGDIVGALESAQTAIEL
ncbi:MAG: tetratricopeptide repeat protein, partial [Chloroflexi bacterium]|nr:tetratricopeptide repeat protein [Chloroflexota bacterium]